MLTVVLAAILLLSATEAKQTARSKARQCRQAMREGPIVNGKKCKRVGLECRSTKAACLGYFDEATQACVDTYLPCECRKLRTAAGETKKSWQCAVARCAAPDERCTCDNPDLVGPDQACYKQGMECPNDEGVVTCYGIWEQATSACTNVTVTPPCSCDSGKWICAFADCAMPDPRC
jgi:hypothetical protein